MPSLCTLFLKQSRQPQRICCACTRGLTNQWLQSILHLKPWHQDLNNCAAEHAWLCSAPCKGCVEGTEPLQSVCRSGEEGKKMVLARTVKDIMSRCPLRGRLAASLFAAVDCQLLLTPPEAHPIRGSCSLCPERWTASLIITQTLLLRAKLASLAV